MRKIVLTVIVVLICWQAVPAATTGSFVAGPYLRDITNTTATIIWETATSVGGKLTYGPSKEQYEFSVEIPPATIGRVVLQNLKPGKVYFYRVQAGNCETPAGDPNYYFKTAYSEGKPFCFAAYADTSSGRNGFDLDHNRVVRSITNFTHPDFVIVNGDLVTNGKSKEDWIRFLQVEGDLIRNVPIYAVLGNNDQNGKRFFREYFTSPRPDSWYSFDYGDCHFIAMDIERGQGEKYYNSFKPGNPQFTWLLRDLQSDRNSKAKFTVVFFHAPVFPPDGQYNQVLLQMLHPLFVKYGVDMVFNGTHSFTRAEKDGIPYFISGGGGAEITPLDRRNRPEIKETAFLLHHLRVSVNYPVINVEVVDINGSVYSSFIYWDPYAKSGKLRPGSTPHTDNSVITDSPPDGKGRIPVTVFSLPNCNYCRTLLKKTLPGIAGKTGLKLNVTYLPLDQAENFEKLVAREQMLNDTGNDLPVVLVGKTILGGQKEIENGLHQLIAASGAGKSVAVNSQTGPDSFKEARREISKRFQSFEPVPVVLAGLLDGINPCAFTTIIFLLSYLFYLGKNKKEILLAGIGFTAGVFLTYTGLGIGFSEILKSLSIYGTISLIIKYLILALVAALGALSLYDFILCLRGNVSTITLQLPEFLKKKIHQQVRVQTKKSRLMTASIAMGALISAFELACTGQIYLPTIIYMLQVSTERLRAYGYLLLYNSAFIIPLVLVFVLAYYGLTADMLAKIFRRNITLVKLATAVFFFLMGVLILVL